MSWEDLDDTYFTDETLRLAYCKACRDTFRVATSGDSYLDRCSQHEGVLPATVLRG